MKYLVAAIYIGMTIFMVGVLFSGVIYVVLR